MTHGIADEGEGLDVAEGIYLRGVKVGDVHHVALFDHGVAVIGRVKAYAVHHGPLVEVRRGDGDVAELALDIDYLEVDHLYALLCG